MLEFLGGYLSAVVGNAFKPIAQAPHRPRITIDRLVVCRESWVFKASEIQWAFSRRDHERYLGAWEWRSQHSISERSFYFAQVEGKPIFVDFTSPVLVDMLGLTIRRSARQDPDLMITITEMLPDVEQLWLADSNAVRYTSEIRLVVFDCAAATTLAAKRAERSNL